MYRVTYDTKDGITFEQVQTSRVMYFGGRYYSTAVHYEVCYLPNEHQATWRSRFAHIYAMSDYRTGRGYRELSFTATCGKQQERKVPAPVPVPTEVRHNSVIYVQKPF